MPSKKFFAVAIGAILVFVSYYLIKSSDFFQNYQGNNPNETQTASLSATSEDRNQDSDGDGLADWEEVLWKTDPLLKDTDGNGITDGDEVKQKKEELTKTNSELASNISDQTLTNTDYIARDLYTTLRANSIQGIVTENAIDYLSELGSDRIKGVFNPTIYTKDDIKIVTEDPASYNSYLNLINNVATNYPFDIEFASTYLETLNNLETFEGQQKIAEIKTETHTIHDLLKNAAVPTSATIPHLELLNAYSSLDEITKNLIDFEQDPVLAVSSFAAYEETFNNIITAYDSMNQYLIVLSQNLN